MSAPTVGTYLHAMMRHSERVYAVSSRFRGSRQLLPNDNLGRKIAVVGRTSPCRHETSWALLQIPVIDGTPVIPVLSTLTTTLRPSPALCRDIARGDGSTVSLQRRCRLHQDRWSKAMSTVCCRAPRRTIERCRPRLLDRSPEERRCAGLRAPHPGFLFRRFGYHGYCAPAWPNWRPYRVSSMQRRRSADSRRRSRTTRL